MLFFLLLLMMTAQTVWSQTTESVKYIDANGIEKTVTATVLTGSETELAAGWYVAKGTLNFTHSIAGANKEDVTIILADGCAMNVGTSDSPITDDDGISNYPNLTIYGQSLTDATAGHLNIYSSNQFGIVCASYTQHSGNVCIRTTGFGDYCFYTFGDITINGGTLDASSEEGCGLYTYDGNITINGGKVTATAPEGAQGIMVDNANKTITLGWTRVTDRIKASRYDYTVTVAPGLAFLTDDDPAQQVSGTVTDFSLINGKTLTPDISSAFTVSADGNTYTIWNANGWDLFCDMLADNAKGIFDGKTVKLGADITVSRMAGGSYHDFTGTFDGDGHTLTLNYGSADSPIDALYVAPFPNTTDNGDSHPTFRNLTIDGTIYDAYSGSEEHHHVGGLIGHLYGTVTIEHCTSRVNITSTKGGAGGFVGLCESAVSFTDCVSSAVIRSTGGNNSGFVGWSRSSSYTIGFTGCVFNGKLLQNDDSGSYNGGFVGWKGDAKTVNITNCLCAPAALADGETEADGGSATFSREHANYAATIQNSYYTRAFGTAQGKQARTITAGENVTVALSGTATEYATSGITSYGTGIKYDHVLYAGEGDNVTLTLGNTPPTGYGLSAYTASAGTLDGTTLTMPDADVVIGATFARLPVSVSYIDGSGAEQTANAQPLSEAGSHDGGWYVVDEDFDTDLPISFTGDVNLILCDGKTLTAKNSITINDGTGTLNTYGQTMGTGMLNASGADGAEGNRWGDKNGKSGANGINGNVIVNSGTVSVKGGKGGSGDVGGSTGSTAKGGSGGNGIDGTFTLNGGTANISGGIGGWNKSLYGTSQRAAHGCGVTGTVTSDVATAIIQESDDNSTWTDLASGSTSTKQYIKAEVPAGNLYIPGDANGDGQVTITDAVAIVNYILGNASADFNPEAANVNGDYDDEGKPNITITDAVAVVNIILQPDGQNDMGDQ